MSSIQNAKHLVEALPKNATVIETAKALKPNGLLLVEGLHEDDLAIAKRCGFTVTYRDDDDTALFQRAHL